MTLVWVGGAGLLLVLAGVVVGRFYRPHTRPLRQQAQEGRSYARGLVRVLEGEAEAAIDELTAALRKNSRPVEPYFALGTLFRQQGEHERAVRVHQSLLVRRDVDKATRLRVHFQVALDFKAAGFPRRAIKALEWVVAHESKHRAALAELATLLEEQRRWERAAAVRKRLGKVTGAANERVVANLLARAAAEALERRELKEARKHLRRAASADPTSTHVLHVLGQYQMRAGNERGAFQAWRKALLLQPELAGFLVPLAETALPANKRVAQIGALLAELAERHPDDVHLRLAAVRWEAKERPSRALSALNIICRDYPQLLPARRELARLSLDSGNPEQIRAALAALLDLLAVAEKGYRCGRCGRVQREMFWRCDPCGAWESARVVWGRRYGERSTGERRST
jgi:lipopolysaccharide biosynthesis regulator YciM